MGEPFKTIFVLGTTASGKSEWSYRWAKRHSGLIFNCDSIQVYKGLDIGAAKPSDQEMASLPHFLFSFVDKGKNLTTGEFRSAFFQALENIKINSAPPLFVVGGSGFYFQALEKGMYPIRKVNPEVAKQIDLELSIPEGLQKLYQELQTKDPVAVQRIHANDAYRIGRALEIIRTEGRSLTEVQNEFSVEKNMYPYPLLKIGVQWPRETLKVRIQTRVENMFKAGLLQEVYILLEQGFGDWRALGSVGYRECVEFLKKESLGVRSIHELPSYEDPQLNELKVQIVQSTMALAKKQRTWFQRDPEIHWFDGETEYTKAQELVDQFLDNSK
ncbi:MAG TPA: tRNA (adenosine(37)-N6)-dimethylallyltransferase MiaA [Pseudobdellovibrionaceae bacterium]|nr:tRNA (adenosine(37)-N6)-dimethylallyltransferase MiaA [Pseudobdellovibrionaceae bacterium]